jgi:hypothetical protein
MSASSQSGGVLLLYIMGYAALVIALAFALLAASGRRGVAGDGAAVFMQLGQARLRWLLIVLVLSMARASAIFFFWM